MPTSMTCDGFCVFTVISVFLFTDLGHCTNKSYVGRLSLNCARHYYQIYSGEPPPPRFYHYAHEVLSPDRFDLDENDYEEVDVKFRIVGGSQVSIEEVPYQVLYGQYCGGVIIAPEWVITAAHCGDSEDFVYAGSTKRSRTTKYPICAHFIHPLWNSTGLHTFDFDYQLVLLENPIPVTPRSLPIAIGSMQDIKNHAMVTVSGWGNMYTQPNPMEDFLRRVRVPIIPLEECRSFPLERYKTVTDRMFCAGLINGTKDSCQGDSGGPAVINGKLVGLVSFGVGCAVKEQPGVYSNVPLVRPWIRSVTGLPL